MAIDLKSMSLKELEEHLKDVENAMKDAHERDRKAAKEAAAKAAAEFGFALHELSDDGASVGRKKRSKSKGSGAKSAPKYANPADKSETWTGKGRQPNWYRDALASGTSPEDLLI